LQVERLDFLVEPDPFTAIPDDDAFSVIQAHALQWSASLEEMLVPFALVKNGYHADYGFWTYPFEWKISASLHTSWVKDIRVDAVEDCHHFSICESRQYHSFPDSISNGDDRIHHDCLVPSKKPINRRRGQFVMTMTHYGYWGKPAHNSRNNL